MVLHAETVKEPIPISVIAGRYLLFNPTVVTYLRSTYNICGVLIGSIPQIPQQNVFLGLPMELLPEEAKLLVGRGVAYIIDAVAWHREKFSTLQGAERRKYLDSLRSEGRKAQLFAEEKAQKRIARGLAKRPILKASKEPAASYTTDDVSGADSNVHKSGNSELSLLGDASKPSHVLGVVSTSSSSMYTVTPTATENILHLMSENPEHPVLHVPALYPLFAHLHSLSYFITPGLRFGCDYTVYPGDPLRFHSHFLAVGYDWTEDIPLIDLVGGGRLGTGVKKGFLIGGKGPTDSIEDTAGVRTFCIEWGGM